MLIDLDVLWVTFWSLCLCTISILVGTDVEWVVLGWNRLYAHKTMYMYAIRYMYIMYAVYGTRKVFAAQRYRQGQKTSIPIKDNDRMIAHILNAARMSISCTCGELQW